MELPKFTMPFEATTIENLGLKLYSYLPRAMAELVSNAWDAEAERVDTTLPKGEITANSEVVVRDYGSGMDANTIQKYYLPIGKNPREDRGDETKNKHRPIMGRKGLGKLSGFGIADIIQMRSIKKGYAICIRLDYNKMKSWPSGKPYEPELIKELTGETSEKDGTEIKILNLKRKTPIDSGLVIKELARRFIVISDKLKSNDKFGVFVNGIKITKKDRRLKESCKKAWNAGELPNKNVIDAAKDWKVSGWIGIVPKSSQIERGVDIFARGKVVEIETMFGLKTTHIQFARAYVVGEIKAEFLDKIEDNISTARDSVIWETEAGQKLAEWGQEALKYVFEQWLETQRKEKEEEIIKTCDFEKWLSTRTLREQRIANKLVKIIASDKDIEPESAKPMLEVIKANVEFQAFQELVDEVEEKGSNVKTLLKLFEDWRIIEAREHLKLYDGRLEIMKQFSDLISQNALEVKQMQPLFEKNGWLIDPSWGEVTGQNRYTKLLRENCKEPQKLEEKDRRIDILGYKTSGIVHVVEIKRPPKVLSWVDLDQIERYVRWARAHIQGTGKSSPLHITGILIVGKLSGKKEVQDKMRQLVGDDIRVDTYDDLLEAAEQIYGEVEKRLKLTAPEYSKEAREKRIKAFET